MSEEDIPEFVGNLQAIGVTLAAYLGAYANAHHPNALEDKIKYEADGAREKKAWGNHIHIRRKQPVPSHNTGNPSSQCECCTFSVLEYSTL